MSISEIPVVIKQEPRNSDSDWTPDFNLEILPAIKMEIMEVKKEIKTEPVEDDNKDGVIDKFTADKRVAKLAKSAAKLLNALNPQQAYRKTYNSGAFYRGHKRRQRTRQHPESTSQRPSDSIINDGTGSKVDYFVRLTNIPQNWSYDDLWGLLKRFQCDLALVKRLSMEKPSGSATKCVKVHLVSLEACSGVKDKLASANVNGKKLIIYCHYIDSNGDTTDSDDTVSTSEPRSKRRKKNPKSWRPDIDVHESDPAGLYGLKAEFLHTLQITPPIDRWVQVSNFRSGKRELEEIMCLAGDVLIINIVHNQVPRTANVMYKHPLEAVQAVSMLNDQFHYSNKLTVKMAPNMCPLTLPVGLECVGPGLGAYGKPLRDIVSQYERFVRRQSNRIDKTAFQSIGTVLAFGDDEHLKKKKPDANKISDNNTQVETNVENEPAETSGQTMDSQTQNDIDGPQSEMENENSNQDIDMADDTQSDVGDENSQDSQNTNQNSQNVDENSQDCQNVQNDNDKNSQNADDTSQNYALYGAGRKSSGSNSETGQLCVVKAKRTTSYRFESSSDGSDSEGSVVLIPSSVAHEIVELDDEEPDLDQPDLDQNETVSKSNQGSNNTSRSNSLQSTPSASPNLRQNCSKSSQNSGSNNSEITPISQVGPTNVAQNKPQLGSLVSQYVPTPIIPGPSGQRMPDPGLVRPPVLNSGPMLGPNPNQMRMNVPGPIGPRMSGPSGPQLPNPMSGFWQKSGPISGPGPNSSPFVPNSFRGPGPNSGPMGPNQIRGPGQGPMMPNLIRGMGPNQGPIVPNPMNGQFRPNQMIGPNPMSMNMPGPSRPMNIPGPSRPMNMPGPMMPGPNRPMNMPGPNGPMNMPGPNPARMGGPMGMAGSNGTTDTVRLSNLPLSTTFPLLSDKMGECGQVMSLQLTSPGCAVVRFANNAQAGNCWQRYNNIIIQGNKVCVTYI